LILKKRDQYTITSRRAACLPDRSEFFSVVRVMDRKVVDEVFAAHHGMAEAKRAGENSNGICRSPGDLPRTAHELVDELGDATAA
jgi:hypothetical protein